MSGAERAMGRNTDGGNLVFGMNEFYAQDDPEIQKKWNASQSETEEETTGIVL